MTLAILEASFREVVHHALAIRFAVVLVILFLADWRTTIIPAITIPVS
jgi:multidrug efflux pump subunit AcrB